MDRARELYVLIGALYVTGRIGVVMGWLGPSLSRFAGLRASAGLGLLFGLALSLPLVAAALFARAREALDWLGRLSRQAPLWAGVVLIILGLWSVGFGLFTWLGQAK